MHSESMMVAGGLAVISLFLISRKNQWARTIGLLAASVAGLMLVAGVTA